MVNMDVQPVSILFYLIVRDGDKDSKQELGSNASSLARTCDDSVRVKRLMRN